MVPTMGKTVVFLNRRGEIFCAVVALFFLFVIDIKKSANQGKKCQARSIHKSRD